MTELDHVLFVQTGKVVAREDLLPAVEEQLKAAPAEVALQFTIRPIAIGEEVSRVLDRLSQVAATNDCHGSCD